MGGPTSAVMLRHPLMKEGMEALMGVVNAVAANGSQDPPTLERFWVNDPKLCGGVRPDYARPLGISMGLEFWWEEEEVSPFEGAFGFAPQEAITLNAFCNGDPDHRILGNLTAMLAEQFNGVVNFGGTLWPPLPKDFERNHQGEGLPWTSVEPFFQEMVAGMPGRVVGLPWDRDDGIYWVSHFSDAAFARAWLEHPRFHMIK